MVWVPYLLMSIFLPVLVTEQKPTLRLYCGMATGDMLGGTAGDHDPRHCETNAPATPYPEVASSMLRTSIVC